MATAADQIISTLLAGTGFGRTPEDVTQQNLQNQGLAQQQTVNDQNIAMNAAKMSAMQRQTANDANFQPAWQAYLKNPTTDGLAQLAVNFPTHAEALKQFWSIKDPEVRQNHIEQIAPVVSLLQNNRPDMAIKHLQTLRDTTAKAGLPTDDFDQEISALQSGDKDAINAVKGTMMMHLASADPDGKFAESVAKIQKALAGPDGYTLGPNDTRFDGNNALVASGQAKPTYEKIRNGDGSESIVQVGGGDGTGTGSVSPATGAPRSVRNNNQGNVRAGAFARSQPGYKGVDDKGYAIFDTPENGASAQSTLLAQNYLPRGQNTVASIIQGVGAPGKRTHGYAPRMSDGGDNTDAQVNNYIGFVAKKLNISPNDTITPAMLPRLASAMAQFESGATGKGGAVRDGGAAPGGGGDARVVFTSKPGNTNPVDDATVDFYAQKIAAGGDLPQLGMGKEAAAWRQAILKRAAQIQTGQGLDGGGSNLLHADVKSAGAALTKLQGIRNSIDPYVSNFHTATSSIRQLAPAAVGGSAPVFNRWIQAGRTNIAGDPVVSKFNYWINAAANENAKIVSGATGGAITSDSARHEAMSLINNAQTLPQLMNVLDAMDKDSAGRIAGLDKRQAALRSTISGKYNGAASSSATIRTATNPRTGERLVLRGNRWVTLK